MRQYMRWGALCVALGVGGCDGSGDVHVQTSGEGASGTLRAALTLPERALDVSGLRIAVLPAGAACDGTALAESAPAWETGTLPEGQGLDGDRPFASALFVLAAGDYRVCATPLAGSAPSESCAAASADVTITPGQTTRIVLTSQCSGADTGAADVIVALNGPPQITGIELDPGSFISRCEALTLAVSATDPDEDALVYAFSVEEGAGATIHGTGSAGTFFGPPGDYTVGVEVADPHGASASLSFPVHVSDASCAVPDAVQAIFAARCAPCHTSGAAGGLSLASAEASYAGLVAVPSSAAACAARVRVVPGEPDQSYLMAKLTGAPDLCGAIMPRGRPPLPEDELDVLAAWIDALPH